jgi:hypothetical protein
MQCTTYLFKYARWSMSSPHQATMEALVVGHVTRVETETAQAMATLRERAGVVCGGHRSRVTSRGQSHTCRPLGVQRPRVTGGIALRQRL